jgi:RimJ/RimL family protein N-acetyltransferase
MEIETLPLGWRTHLIFPRFDAQIEDRGDHLVVRTPHNPTYWWGNFLLYAKPPREGQADDWIAEFDATIRLAQPESAHLAFGIAGGGDFELPADFAAAGLVKHRTTVLTLKRELLDPAVPPLSREYGVRALELPARIGEIVELESAINAGEHAEPGYSQFREREMQRYTAMQDAGLGHWFGVFARQQPKGERLVASCGLFREKRGFGMVSRFRDVGTHPEWRQRGLATALLHAVCRHGFEVMGDETIVIATDPDDRAIRIYEAIGFEREDDIYSLERPPRGSAASA